jgi:hypothetical protein
MSPRENLPQEVPGLDALVALKRFRPFSDEELRCLHHALCAGRAPDAADPSTEDLLWFEMAHELKQRAGTA